jgi:hypothetical protein
MEPEKKEWISRAEAARRLGVSHAMIRQYVVKYGLPCHPRDGRIPWPCARDWKEDVIHSQRSGNYVHRLLAKYHADARAKQVQDAG